MLRKTVIITGAFGGIGRATAEKFAQNGYNLALTYNNNFDLEFIAKLKTYNIEVLALQCDQSKENDIINFVNSAFKEFEYIETLVCNAGKSETVNVITEKSIQEIDELISVNLRGTILFNKEVIKHFLKQKHGNIINISSIYGLSGGSLESIYSACKAGVIGLTKSLAVECAPFIRVNAVAPGCTDTPMTSYLTETDKKEIISSTPLERIATPEDIANAIYFLASDESSFITGEVLPVTGGVVRF